MAEVPHDPSVTLRLELGRVTDQRDAYKAALTTEVLKVVRVAIIQATIDTDNQIAFLKAEVERLTKAIDLTIIDLDERHERQDLRAWEFAELLRKAKGVQS